MRTPRMHRSAQRSAQSTQAPIDKQTHDQRQAEIFNRKTEAFSADLPEDIKQAILRLCASCKDLRWATHNINPRCSPQTHLCASSQSFPAESVQAMDVVCKPRLGSRILPSTSHFSNRGMQNVHTGIQCSMLRRGWLRMEAAPLLAQGNRLLIPGRRS